MKKILVKYTMEVDDNKFEKACRQTMIGTNPMMVRLRDMAEIHGRVSVYDFVDEIIGDKSLKPGDKSLKTGDR